MANYGDLKIRAQRIGLFETPVVTAHFDGAAGLLEDLEAAIRAQRDADPDGIRRSNIPGWHSRTDMLQWGGHAAQTLAEKAVAMAQRMSNFTQGGTSDFQWPVQMWANISGSGASNHMHVHPGNLWSAVLYVRMGGEGPAGDDISNVGGEFYFEDPRFPLTVMHNTSFRFVGADGEPQRWQPEFQPKRGDFLMFPAWLRHGVRPYRGGEERISIALNVDAIRR